ncbi:uncharacterized protein [Parasteatoda tepidariorum]|uniref:uncharacterized protein isoform X1 n=2 Tax=Parasteatoda tepidariorum TaxID=114398 RepID=UPI00077FCA93|nr:uncharacterized protein LOC107439218 isoform X2 [Parasteatoda tepidariorum]
MPRKMFGDILTEEWPEFGRPFEESSTKTLGTDDQMGNGTSQSIILGSPRFQSSVYSTRNGYYDNRGVPKYVHPQNRVLPQPIAGQRLRSTDNGSILQTAGTIRGQRRGSTSNDDRTDPEMMGILRKRSELIEKDEDCYHQFNLRNHRLFHSDPNISRRPVPNGYEEDPPEMYSNRRSCTGGAAVRTSKMKYKKKARAPDPPPSGNSLPRQLERKSPNIQKDGNGRNMACKCIGKSKAPQPPAIVVHPPPPPPLPSMVTTRTMVNVSHHSKSQSELLSRSPYVTRAVASRDSKMGYEKNVHPLEKWRNCRSSGDVRIDEQDESSPSRTTVFDSRKIPESQTKVPSYLPHRPDPFQKEIQAVTQKIAQSRQTETESPVTTARNENLPQSSTDITPNSKSRETTSPPKFYFADVEIFKMGSKKTDLNPSEDVKQSDKRSSVEETSKFPALRIEDRQLPSSKHDSTNVDEIVPSLQRFSPARKRFKSPSRSSTPSYQQNGQEKDWDSLLQNMQSKNSIESEIDLRLRPVLPRKTSEVPKFSASKAWQALGSDGQGSSNHSTSDDGRDCPSPYKKNGFIPQNQPYDRGRRQSDINFNRYKSNNDGLKQRSLSDSHWTPRQDLLDDSDVSSEDSEEAVVPRIQPDLNEISTRFSLPTVMFSNMRPIGSELKSNSTPSPGYLNGSSRYTQSSTKKKGTKQTSSESAPTFKRLLSKRNKYMSEEDIVVSDSNWTFGQYGLQKRGKQYCSDLMLSDKKKYEMMMKNNFSDFLGDILMNKADHMRKQLKSSDSGNSNFSFYSTEGQIMYAPEKGGFVKEDICSPPTKGRVSDMRRKFDGNFESNKPNFSIQHGKKKGNVNGIEMGRKRDLELAKMLEDEVRKRRNKEKITIRQQLQRMKSLHVDEDDEEDFDDEAYFTEPKSREDSQSPFFASDLATHAQLGIRPFRFQTGMHNGANRLSHWQSSPALLEDSVQTNGMRPTNKGRLSMSSVMSSPDPEAWTQSRAVDSWLSKQKRNLDSPPRPKKISDHSRILAAVEHANDGDVSSSPTPAPPKKERRKTNIYKQLMDIVRKEERHLKNAQKNGGDHNSRDSSYSQRESSPSTLSESSSTSSYSYSDSSSARNHGLNGVPANKEFHSSGYNRSSLNTENGTPSFQVAFVQPYTPSKSYRPVPFDIVHSSASNYRMTGLPEEGKHVQAEVS